MTQYERLAARQALARSQARMRAYWRHIDQLRDQAREQELSRP